MRAFYLKNYLGNQRLIMII